MAFRIQDITVEIGGDSDRKRKMLDAAVSPTVAPRWAERQPIAKQSQFSGKIKTRRPCLYCERNKHSHLVIGIKNPTQPV